MKIPFLKPTGLCLECRQRMDGQNQRELGKEVLREVSRSFYLSLRALPSGMREATSVGYLLARASDTIADCGGAREARLSLLDAFLSEVNGEEEEGFFEAAARLAEEEGLKDGERALMRRLPEVFQWWMAIGDEAGEAVHWVINTIVSGQRWDLERFPEGETVSLTEADELEEYCYRVAGCVGEFWTEIGFLNDPCFADEPAEVMRDLGRNYGKGLQLVNILRDEVEDEQRGRRYLPGPREEWLERAESYLEQGLDYSAAVRNRRARMATVLPALIGRETLALLRSASCEDLAQGIKVERKVVKSCLGRALCFPRKR